MKDERKKEFVLRISQANNVEMILIEYEMAPAGEMMQQGEMTLGEMEEVMEKKRPKITE